MRFLLFAHMLLVVLAGTAFTILTFFWDGNWFVEFYKYWSSSGFGKIYESPYCKTVILTYIAAFLVGLVADVLVSRSSSRVAGAIGILASLLGLYCFGNEYFQLGRSEYDSWIVVSPLFMLVLAAYSAIPSEWLLRQGKAIEKQTSGAG